MTSSRYIRRIRDHVTTISKKVAAQYGVSFGVVLSRNPDGSLNVDDGMGGCVRVMTAGNYRIGEKVPIGTEPAIGTTTNLSPYQITVSPSGQACPNDPRTPPLTIKTFVSNSIFGRVYTTAGTWAASRSYAPIDPSYPHYGTAIDIGTQTFQTAANNDNAWPKYICVRGFLIFDASSLPPNAVIMGASLTMTPAGAVTSNDGIDFSVVRSSFAGFPLVTTYFDDVDPHAILATSHILDWTTGVPKTIEIAAPSIDDDGFVRLAILTSDDINNVAPPLNHTNAISFTETAGANQITIEYGVL